MRTTILILLFIHGLAHSQQAYNYKIGGLKNGFLTTIHNFNSQRFLVFVAFLD